MLLHEYLTNGDYEDFISGRGNKHNVKLPDDSYLGADWSRPQKAMYFRFVVERLRRRGINVHLASSYSPKMNFGSRLEILPRVPSVGVPVAELTVENDIYLNAKSIGYSLSFLSMLCLYGHRVQIERARQQLGNRDVSPHGLKYCVGGQLPDSAPNVDADYQLVTGCVDADYATEVLAVKRRAFVYGTGLLKHAPKLDTGMQYAINTFIATTSMAQVTSAEGDKAEPEDLRERFARIYGRFEQNLGAIVPGFAPIKPKGSPFRKFDWAPYGAVIRNG